MEHIQMAQKDYCKSQQKVDNDDRANDPKVFSASLGKQAQCLEWIRTYLSHAFPNITREGCKMEVGQCIWLRD